AGAYEPYGNRFRNNYATHLFIANESCAYFSLNASGIIQDNGSWCVGMYIRCIQDSTTEDIQTKKLKNVSLKYSEAVKSQFVHRIGDYKYGGIIYELWKDEKGIENGMVVSLNDLSRKQAWTNAEGRIGWKATSRDNGLRNSTAIITQKGHTESATKLCIDYSFAGYDDWFLPAIEDLISIRKNKDVLNKTLSRVRNADQIASMIYQYWSSTESMDGNPIVLEFYYGEEKENNDRNYKYYDISTRAVRLFNSNSASPDGNVGEKNGKSSQQIIDTTITVIHGQNWMTKNLDVIKFRNGDIIPQITSNDEWSRTKTPAWCYYNNDSLTGKQFGKLYNWYAVNDPRGLAPTGWHIPSLEEVQFLASNLGGADKAGIELKAKNGWEGLGRGENGTNSTGFNALPGGFRYWDGRFTGKSEYSYWWTATVSHQYDSMTFSLYYLGRKVEMFGHPKNEGIYVRCIKD
ncbi:MAG: FISUMP domain-containing protein, partial [Ignavibacteria bacterium]